MKLLKVKEKGKQYFVSDNARGQEIRWSLNLYSLQGASVTGGHASKETARPKSHMLVDYPERSSGILGLPEPVRKAVIELSIS